MVEWLCCSTRWLSLRVLTKRGGSHVLFKTTPGIATSVMGRDCIPVCPRRLLWQTHRVSRISFAAVYPHNRRSFFAPTWVVRCPALIHSRSRLGRPFYDHNRVTRRRQNVPLPPNSRTGQLRTTGQ